MTSNFSKIIEISKKIAKSLLKNEPPKSLESSNLFYQSDKDYILDQLTNKENIRKRIEVANMINETDDWKSLKSKINVPVRKLYWKYAAIASVLILISLTVFLKEENNVQLADSIISNPNIEPGTDKAILTLSDGSQIALEKGKHIQTQNANSNGEEIIYKTKQSNIKEAVYNYLTIPRKGQFFIKLSDGTKVWLNSESQLKYPVNFIKGESRQVELVYGEAYFDVSPSSNHKGSKFKVFNQSQEVQVLGTEFNIKAYKDETNVYTTLIEGKVDVIIDNNKQSLIPNQQINLDLKTNNVSIIKNVDTYNEISWKEGVFIFEGQPLKNIVKVLSRWYNLDFVFEDKSSEEKKFNGSLSRKLKINEILDIIKKFNKIKDYKINEKTVIIK